MIRQFISVVMVIALATAAVFVGLRVPFQCQSVETQSHAVSDWYSNSNVREHIQVMLVGVNDAGPSIGYVVRTVGGEKASDIPWWWKEDRGNVWVRGRRIFHDRKQIQIFVSDEGAEPELVEFDRATWQPIPNELGGTWHGVVNIKTARQLWIRVMEQRRRNQAR